MLKQKACIDSFGVGTNMGASVDAPFLDVIYKISEVTDDNGKFLPTMKLSKGKVTYPGRKQVFRIKDKQGRFIKDILGLEKERIKGKPLLIKVVDKGNIIYKSPSLEKIKQFCQNNLSHLPVKLKAVYAKYKYSVMVSPQLEKLRRTLTHYLEKRQ
jgi:nicotinate phosphoribosyltransferase